MVTEKTIPKVAFTNINSLYSLQVRALSPNEEKRYFEYYKKQISANANLTIIELSKSLDSGYGLEPSESLFQLRVLLARRFFHFDIFIPFIKLRCAELFNAVDEVLNFSGE